MHSSIAASERDDRFHLVYIVDENNDETLLRDFLYAQQLSSRTLTAIKHHGGLLLVNGIEQTVRHVVARGDRIDVYFPKEYPSESLTQEEGPLRIIKETSTYLIVYKPPQQATMPSKLHPTGTLANYLAAYLAKQPVPSNVHIVTRLDVGTSGLVCVAKNRHIHHLFSEQLNDGEFHRLYEAVVDGELFYQLPYMIDAPIARKHTSIIERVVDVSGKRAQTVIEQKKTLKKDGNIYTLLQLRLLTGRTHQIRVHLRHLGYPIIGDTLYGGRETGEPMMLHCSQLQFKDPLTKKEITVTHPFIESGESLFSND